MTIPIENLVADTLRKLGLTKRPVDNPVEPRVIAFGKILQCLTGLTNREGLWALRQAQRYLETARFRKQREGGSLT